MGYAFATVSTASYALASACSSANEYGMKTRNGTGTAEDSATARSARTGYLYGYETPAPAFAYDGYQYGWDVG